MTFDALVRRVAIREQLTQAAARRLVTQLFDDIKIAILLKDGRVNIPQFGVFVKREQKSTTRPVGGVPTRIRGSTRVIFRAGSGAKRLE